MIAPKELRLALILFLPAHLACRETSAPGAIPLPAALEIVAEPGGPSPTVVGSIAGDMIVRVRDANGNALSGVVVAFSLATGSGSVSPAVDTTRTDGTATTTLTIGTIPGAHRVNAAVSKVAPVTSTSLQAIPGATTAIRIRPGTLRFLATADSSIAAAVPVDRFGNSTGIPVTWSSRNSALVAATTRTNNSGVVRVVSRPGQTHVIVTTGSLSDSILVSVLDASSPMCAFVASPVALTVGGSVSFDDSGIVCASAPDADADFVLVTHFGTPATTSLTVAEALGMGIVGTAAAVVRAPTAAEGRDEFETALRDQERREVTQYVRGARATFRQRPRVALVSAPAVGALASVNVNALDYCARPKMTTARVVAVTNTAIILADTANPPGGFSDAEYQEFGVALDTLVTPVVTSAFGSSSDIDNNGRVAILFTKAVNELTPPGITDGIVFGFYYIRDLLPRTSPFGACPGSNVSEMFYVLVPDPGAIVADARSKDFVQSIAISTIAHEYQHLINASRRMYVTNAPSVTEELWLNEGLSHMAEELVFYDASGLQPRQNIGAIQLQTGTPVRSAFDTYMRNNIARYVQYLRSPALNSPIATDDQIATRGAAWAFLRYVADHALVSDGDFWKRLVDSPRTGVDNLNGALTGSELTVIDALRDWSISAFADDVLPGADARHQHLSWNFASTLPAVGLAFDLVPSPLMNGSPQSWTLRAGGTAFMRFGVPQGQEALVQVTGFNGTPLPAALRLTLLRTR